MADGQGPWAGGTQLVSAGVLTPTALVSVDMGGSVTAVTSAGAIAGLADAGSSAGIVNTNITTVGNGTLTGAGLVGGLINRSGPVAAFTDATDTAANILKALPGFVSGGTFVSRIKNGNAQVMTITAGSGVTLPATNVIGPFQEAWYYGTMGGTAAAPTVVFSHLITSPIAVAISNSNPVITALATNGNGTVLAAAINGGIVSRTTVAAPFTDTTDTAAAIIANNPGLVGKIGESFLFLYSNNSTGLATLTGGSGVTVSGITTIQPSVTAEYLVTYTAASTITMVGIRSSAALGGNPVLQVTPVQVAATSAAVGPAIPLGIPAGATVTLLTADTVTAFTGATVSAVIGSASGDASYMAVATIKNGGRVTLLPTTAAGAAAFLSVPGGSGLVLTLSQGTPTAVGSATVQGGYVI